MTRIETTATVTPDGRVTVDVPPHVRLPPGQHRVVTEFEVADQPPSAQAPGAQVREKAPFPVRDYGP